jgi:hypothetical protein
MLAAYREVMIAPEIYLSFRADGVAARPTTTSRTNHHAPFSYWINRTCGIQEKTWKEVIDRTLYQIGQIRIMYYNLPNGEEIPAMRKMLLFFALSGFVLFFGCAFNEKALQESGAKLFNQQDLIEFFKVERVTEWTEPQYHRWKGTMYYHPNGTIEGTINMVGYGDEGEYRIENGLICSKFTEWEGGKEKCQRFYYNGEKKYVMVNLDGSLALSMTLIK